MNLHNDKELNDLLDLNAVSLKILKKKQFFLFILLGKTSISFSNQFIISTPFTGTCLFNIYMF